MRDISRPVLGEPEHRLVFVPEARSHGGGHGHSHGGKPCHGHGHGHGAWVTSGGPWGSLWGALSTPRNRASGGSGRAVLAFLFTPIPAGGLLV